MTSGPQWAATKTLAGMQWLRRLMRSFNTWARGRHKAENIIVALQRSITRTDEVGVIQGNGVVSKTMLSGSHRPAACFAYAEAKLPSSCYCWQKWWWEEMREPAPPSPGHALSLPSSTVGVASPDLQGELIRPSVLEQQKFSFSYIAEMPGTGSVTSYSITEMITSIPGQVWHPYCTKDVDKLGRIQDGAARRIQSQEKMP